MSCGKMVICRFGGLTPNSYTTFNLASNFSRWKIWEALPYATVSFTCASSVSSRLIHVDVTSRSVGKKVKKQERKQINLPEEHCKPSVSFSAKCKALIFCSSGGITNYGRPKHDLRNTSCVFRPTLSHDYGKPLWTSDFRVCVFDKYGETFRSFLNKQGLSDYSAFQIRNFHQLPSLSWQPCAGISRTKEYPCTATLGHLPLERVSSCPAAGRCKSTTTTRDKLRARIRSKLPDLKEEELEEQFVRGSGPGGQATNKTSNCVVLKHIPTGLVVKCHQTRSQSENQKIARLLMKERLDQHLHADQSAISQYQQTMNKKREEKKRKTRLKLEKLKALRSSVDDDDEKSSSTGNGNQDVTDKDL